MKVLLAFLSLSVLFSCTPEERLGRNDSDGGADPVTPHDGGALGVDAGGMDAGSMDAGSLDAGAPDATPPDAAPLDAGDGGREPVVCDCGPESCGTRICGRSDCGYLCGECGEGEFCFSGTLCETGVGPGTPCVGLLGEHTWEGDQGFRACAAEGEAQRCTCTGEGADGWFSCGACEPLCVPDLAGQPCDGTEDCWGLDCHPDYEVCTLPCSFEADDCPSGLTCISVWDIFNICMPECSECRVSDCGEGMTCAPRTHTDPGGAQACLRNSWYPPECME